jgi:biotin carboxylase
VFDDNIVAAGIADRHIFYPPYFVEMGHTIPTAASEANVAAIWEAFCAGVRALGLTHGAAKGDVKLTPAGPMIGEIAARLSGGYMSGWTYPLASGVDVVKAAVRLAAGMEPGPLTPLRHWTCAERAFISGPGVVEAVEGLEEARRMEYVTDVFCRVKPGDTVVFPTNNVSKCGNVIACAPTRDEAIAAAEKAAQAVRVRLR